MRLCCTQTDVTVNCSQPDVIPLTHRRPAPSPSLTRFSRQATLHTCCTALTSTVIVGVCAGAELFGATLTAIPKFTCTNLDFCLRCSKINLGGGFLCPALVSAGQVQPNPPWTRPGSTSAVFIDWTPYNTVLLDLKKISFR